MPSMARFGRAKKPPKPETNQYTQHANSKMLAPSTLDSPRRPPRVSLAHVEPDLNMHQVNGLFGDDSSGGQLGSSPDAMIPPSEDHHLNGSTNPTNGDNGVPQKATLEWSSAVGHAATGKSGRVIHNLQEEIARLTRECGVYRSRAEETQRMNEAYKTQVQNITERLRNLEQAHETNLQSITRKDKKIDELRVELKSERDRRVQADGEKVKINQLMDEAADEFHRKCAELQEIANHSRTQYDVLAAHSQRERADQQRKLNSLREDFTALKKTHENKGSELERLDEITAQKDREIQTARENFNKLFTEYEAYKKVHDDDVRTLVEKGRHYDDRIESLLAALQQTEGQMKWVMRVKEEVKEAE